MINHSPSAEISNGLQSQIQFGEEIMFVPVPGEAEEAIVIEECPVTKLMSYDQDGIYILLLMSLLYLFQALKMCTDYDIYCKCCMLQPW